MPRRVTNRIRVSAIVLFLVGSQLCGAQDRPAATLETILTYQLENMNAIQSLDYEFRFSHFGGEAPPVHEWLAQDWTEVGRIRYQGALWRGDSRLTNDGDSPLPRVIEAFDGENYQIFDGNGRFLAVRQESVYGMPFGFVPPTLRPFSFAFDDAHLNGYEVLKQENAWKERFDTHQARVLEEKQRVGDYDCVVVQLRIPPSLRPASLDVRQNVYFAEDEAYYPVLVEVFSEAEQYTYSRTSVEELKLVETDYGVVRIPMVVILESWHPDGSPLNTNVWEVDGSTLRVNKTIDGSEFTISPMLALHYEDDTNPTNSFSMPHPPQIRPR